jgi:pimeloyl-ACP methyl ester carboxylesterase
MGDVMSLYKDIYYPVSDGLTLYARDYPNADAEITVLCMHGLTRNSADFEDIALELNGRCRVISVDQRGRGLSQWDERIERYNPVTYVQDMWQLLDQLHIDKVLLLGTSMGGLMSMMMAAQAPERILGVILNDIGPQLDSKGLDRIKSYVGKGQPVETWVDAVAETQRLNGSCFPDYGDAQWLQMAYRLYRENTDGVPVLAYDPAIAKPIADSDEAAVPPDLWPLFNAMAGKPVLALRGALSDLLSEACFIEMQRQLPEMVAVTVPRVGHAPALDESAAVIAIKDFIAHVINTHQVQIDEA